MAASARGDVLVTIGGKEYVLTPKFKAINAIEAATDKGLLELLTSVGTLKAGVITTVLYQALRANDFTSFSYEEVGEAVMDNLGDPEQPLTRAAVAYLNAFFPKGEAGTAKKPGKSAKVTG